MESCPVICVAETFDDCSVLMLYCKGCFIDLCCSVLINWISSDRCLFWFGLYLSWMSSDKPEHLRRNGSFSASGTATVCFTFTFTFSSFVMPSWLASFEFLVCSFLFTCSLSVPRKISFSFAWTLRLPTRCQMGNFWFLRSSTHFWRSRRLCCLLKSHSCDIFNICSSFLCFLERISTSLPRPFVELFTRTFGFFSGDLFIVEWFSSRAQVFPSNLSRQNEKLVREE